MFKEFVRKNDYIYDMVKNKERSWQELYEYYDIYGEDAEVFKLKQEKNVESTIATTSGITTLVNAVKSIDVNKVNEGLDSIKKIAGMFSSLTTKDDNVSTKEDIRKRRYKRFDE